MLSGLDLKFPMSASYQTSNKDKPGHKPTSLSRVPVPVLYKETAE